MCHDAKADLLTASVPSNMHGLQKRLLMTVLGDAYILGIIQHCRQQALLRAMPVCRDTKLLFYGSPSKSLSV